MLFYHSLFFIYEQAHTLRLQPQIFSIFTIKIFQMVYNIYHNLEKNIIVPLAERN